MKVLDAEGLVEAMLLVLQVDGTGDGPDLRSTLERIGPPRGSKKSPQMTRIKSVSSVAKKPSSVENNANADPEVVERPLLISCESWCAWYSGSTKVTKVELHRVVIDLNRSNSNAVR